MRSKSSAGPFFSSTRRATAPSSRSQSTSAVIRRSSPSLSSRAIHSRMSTKLIAPASLPPGGARRSCDRLDPHVLEAGLRLEQADQTLAAPDGNLSLERHVNAVVVDTPGHEHEGGRRQRHDEVRPEPRRPPVDVPLVADDAAEDGPDDQANQELARKRHAPSAGATSPRKRLNCPCWFQEPKRSAMCPTPASKYARSSSAHCLGLPAMVHCSTNSRENFDV